MSKMKQRIAGLALAATASAGVTALAVEPAHAADGQYITTYQYRSQCDEIGLDYVHYDGATSWSCNLTVDGYALYVVWQA